MRTKKPSPRTVNLTVYAAMFNTRGIDCYTDRDLYDTVDETVFDALWQSVDWALMCTRLASTEHTPHFFRETFAENIQQT